MRQKNDQAGAGAFTQVGRFYKPFGTGQESPTCRGVTSTPKTRHDGTTSRTAKASYFTPL